MGPFFLDGGSGDGGGGYRKAEESPDEGLSSSYSVLWGRHGYGASGAISPFSGPEVVGVLVQVQVHIVPVHPLH